MTSRVGIQIFVRRRGHLCSRYAALVSKPNANPKESYLECLNFVFVCPTVISDVTGNPVITQEWFSHTQIKQKIIFIPVSKSVNSHLIWIQPKYWYSRQSVADECL